MEEENELRSRPAASCQLTHETETTPLLETSFSAANRTPSTASQCQDDVADCENMRVTPITEAVRDGQEGALRELLANCPAEEVHQEVKRYLLLHEAIDKSSPQVLKMLLDKLNEQEGDSYEDVQPGTSNCLTEEQINAQDSDQYTTLHKAAIKNKPKMLKLLIGNGGKVDTRNDREQTPLHIAAWKGSADCTDILIENIPEDKLKSYLDSVDKKNATALMRAAKYSHLKVCKKLTASNPDLQDEKGDTALHHAARSGCKAVVQLLLFVCRADSSIKNKNGELAVETAVSSGKDIADCFILLLEKTPTTDKTSLHANLLKEATLNKSIKCLKAMLKCDNFRELRDHQFTDDGNTILHYSLIKKHYEIARLLLDENVSKNICNKKLELPAHLLAMIPPSEYQDEDHVRSVHKKILKDMRENLGVKNINRKNLLELAVASGNEEMIRHLLRYQCSRVAGVLKASQLGKESSLKRLLKTLPSNQAQELNQERPHPLHLAAKNGHLGCCAALMDTFKDPGLLLLEDEEGNYPVDLAYHGNHFDVFRFLLQKMKRDPKLESFSFRLHQYCEESVSDNISDRRDCIETIVASEWCREAFDSKYCRNGSAGREQRTDEEQSLQDENPSIVQTLANPEIIQIEAEPPALAKPLCRSLAKLVRSYPDLACKILDKHVILTRTEETEEEIKANPQLSEWQEWHDYAPFEPIVTTIVEDDQNPTPSVTCYSKARGTISWENHPLLASLDTDNKEVLTHPLSKSWLNYKYNSYAKWLLCFCVVLDALNAIFTSSMFGLISNTYQLETIYNGATREEIIRVYATVTPLDSIDPTIRSMVQEIQTTSFTDPKCSHFANSTTTGMDKESGMYPLPGTEAWNRTVCVIVQLQQKTGWVIGLQAMVIVLFLANVLIATFLFFRMRKNIVRYLKGVNLVRIAQLVLLFQTIALRTNCDFLLGMRQEYVWICGLFSVLLAWMNLIITLSRIPTLTGYMQISGKFFSTYVKGILFILFIILAFALTFFFLLQTEERAFSTIPYSFVKTMIWMLGEFDYNETFIDNDLPLTYRILSNCLFTLFITVIVGFVFNVIVSSPKALLDEIRERSAFNKAKASLMLIYFADLGVPFLRRPFDRKLVQERRKKPYHSASLPSSSTAGPTDVSPHDQNLRHLEILEQFQQMKDDISQLAQMKDDFKEMTQTVRDLQTPVRPRKKSIQNY